MRVFDRKGSTCSHAGVKCTTQTRHPKIYSIEGSAGQMGRRPGKKRWPPSPQPVLREGPEAHDRNGDQNSERQKDLMLGGRRY